MDDERGRHEADGAHAIRFGVVPLFVPDAGLDATLVARDIQLDATLVAPDIQLETRLTFIDQLIE